MSILGMLVSSSLVGLSKDRVQMWVGLVNCACKSIVGILGGTKRCSGRATTGSSLYESGA
jgi:hypothetical protein